MRKTVAFLIFIGFVHACSSIYYGEDNAPKPVKLSDNYTPEDEKASPLRQTLIEEGEKQINAKYKPSGTTPRGFDCSGFTSYVYSKISIDISRSSQSQAKKGEQIKVKETKPGDLIFFTGTGKNKISHVAMVVSNDSKGVVVIHSTTSRGVIKDNITYSKYWNPKVLFARRIID